MQTKMDSKASIDFQNFNRTYASKQRLSYGSMQYLNQKVSIFKTLVGVVLLILAAYLLLFIKNVNDKNLTKEIINQQKHITDQENVIQIPVTFPELQQFNQLRSFDQIFGLTKLECGKEEGFEQNLQNLKGRIKSHQGKHDYSIDHSLFKKDQIFLESFKQNYQSFKENLESFLIRKKALLEMKFKYNSFLKEYETQLSSIEQCDNLTRQF